MFLHCELLILILVLINDGQAVIGGREAAPHSKPYMVLLEWHLQDGRTKHCGGFLLNEDFVMTAASCRGRSYVVFLGVHKVRQSNEVQKISVKQSFPHKDYDAKTFKNDIMLLQLSSKANFSNYVRPIALADQDSLPKSCSISGWGTADRNTKYMSVILMEVSVTLTDSEQCDEDFYCSEGDIGPGKGDSGGPLVCDGKAYGVVSHRLRLNSGGPGISRYAKIPGHRSWIDSTMKNALKSTLFFCLAH